MSRNEVASASEALAAWGANLEWGAVAADQRKLVGLRVLDTVGLILAGGETQAARAAATLAEELGGKPEATLFPGGVKTSASNAALVHGTVAHCRDFDDTFQDSVVHPGSTTIAAALAVGEATSAPDEEIATAILLGYEAAARIGGAVGRGFHARGFHATSVVGPLSAALVAARLYRLSASATADALGLAASMSGGLMSFVDDGSWSKWLHVGWSAHGGVIAAQLAAKDFNGPRGILDGRHNLFGAFAARPAPESQSLFGDLGARWHGDVARFKYYPCAHVIQPYIDAAIALREQHRIAPASIAHVGCVIAPWAVPIVCEPRGPKLRPETDMDAIASLPYQVSVALIDGRVDLDALGVACRSRADVHKLADRIDHEVDESLGHDFDGTLHIRLTSGETLSSAVVCAPPDYNKLVSKFRANAQLAVDRATVAKLEEIILGNDLPKFCGIAKVLQEAK